MQIEMPHGGWRPRPHQRRLWEYFNDPKDPRKQFDGIGKRAIEIAHRRWGKDDVALHLTAKASVARPGVYWHLLPEYEQARKAIWTAVNPHTGIRRIDEAFPHAWRSNTNDRDMFIRFKWGAVWQVIGSDNYQSLVGTPPVGLVLSEWAKAHPGAWAYLAPILIENKGWALAITTPEGRNHACSMYEMAKRSKDWFHELQTIEDSIAINRAAGVEPTVTLAQVEAQRAEYHSIYGAEAGDALIQQEYYCSFQAAVLGAFWGKELEKAENEGRICEVDIVPWEPVHRAWDIGVDDPMAIWCYQVFHDAIHIVDYIEGSGFGFDWYADELARRGYLKDKRGVDHFPHDVKQREPGAPQGRTRIASAKAVGLNPVQVPDHKPMDRVNAGRRILRRCYFDADRCGKGLDCLREARADWDPINRVFRRAIKHNWASHGFDAFGHLAVSVVMPNMKPAEKAKFTGIVPKPITVNDLLKAHKSQRRGD